MILGFFRLILLSLSLFILGATMVGGLVLMIVRAVRIVGVLRMPWIEKSLPREASRREEFDDGFAEGYHQAMMDTRLAIAELLEECWEDDLASDFAAELRIKLGFKG
jgi:hypothetical protein